MTELVVYEAATPAARRACSLVLVELAKYVCLIHLPSSGVRIWFQFACMATRSVALARRIAKVIRPSVQKR